MYTTPNVDTGNVEFENHECKEYCLLGSDGLCSCKSLPTLGTVICPLDTADSSKTSVNDCQIA